MVMLLFFLSNNLFFFHLLGNFLHVVRCIPIQFRTQCIRILNPKKSLMTENDRDLNDRTLWGLKMKMTLNDFNPT